MSELIKTQRRNENFRRTLLANVSVLALLGYLGVSTGAQASADGDHPIIWVELGGQFERSTGEAAIFSPPFFSQAKPADLAVLTGAQQLPPFTTGFEGKISFTPEDSNWIFSGAIRFGRSGTVQHLHHQSAGFPAYREYFINKYRTAVPQRQQFADAIDDSKETHAILDFQAGKDVGFGLFGAHGSSVVSAGVRFAQFTAASDATLHARPVYSLGPTMTGAKYKGAHFDKLFRSNTAIVHSRRSTRAIGPSLSWDASASIAGSDSNTSLNFDWGINATILFGRQRIQAQHQTTGFYQHNTKGLSGLYNPVTSHYTRGPFNPVRSRTVTIPNTGGFAGLTISHGITMVKFGYRGDFFFNAMDGGIDKGKSQTVGFYGPFASVRVGLGG